MVTSRLLEAFLACPVKCHMLSKHELPDGTEYSTWAIAREESYRQASVRKLTIPETKPNIASPEPGAWKSESWQFAVAKTVRAEGWEAEIAMIQQIPQPRSLSRFVPIRFVANNRLSSLDKTIAAFEAIVLAKALGRKTDTAKIVYGEKQAMLTVNAAALSRSVHRKVAQVVALLTGSTRPDTVINRHCPECGFNDRCRKDAVAKDDLSLLSNLNEKERAGYRCKGIFTVSQLAYTFRPRRRSKRLASRPERYHHALKALAIREQKIHVVGKLDPPMEGTPVFLDVEALPDRDFYYLIGVRVDGAGGAVKRSLWADSLADEKKIWEDFLGILSEVERPTILHYGSFEKTFMKRMCDRYGGPPESSIAAMAIASSTNLITLLYARIYFPTYSNGLKEIAQFLGFSWTDPSVSGLLSIAWRSRWEESRDVVLRDRLITYNKDDCDALCLVARTIARLQSPGVSADRTEVVPEVIHAEELGRNIQSKWRVFKSPLPDMESINAAAYWNYQRDRVFVCTGKEARPITKQQKQKNLSRRKAEKVVVAIPPLSCPKCGKSGRTKSRLLTRTVEDLVFGRDSVKRRVVQYMFQGYRCRSCRHEYGLSEWYLHARKWGWNVVAYFIYNVVALRVPQLTMQHSLNRLFGFDLVRSTLNNLKIKAAERYSLAKRKILERIVGGDLVHADETRANIKGHLAYVWVLTNMTEVVYVLAESREAEIVHDLLKDFKGVLVSDFYAAYDSVPCPQQKCLIHLMRDLNDEMLAAV